MGKLSSYFWFQIVMWRIKTENRCCRLSHQITSAQVCVAEIKYSLITFLLRKKIHGSTPSASLALQTCALCEFCTAVVVMTAHSGFRLTAVGLPSFNKNISVSVLLLLQQRPCERKTQFPKSTFNQRMSNNLWILSHPFSSTMDTPEFLMVKLIPDFRFYDVLVFL